MQDDLLETLVSIINGMDNAEYGITLTVAGSTVSGRLIPNHRWMEGVADMHRARGEGGAALAALFTGRQKQLQQQRDDEKVVDEAVRDLPGRLVAELRESSKTGFIHLKEVWLAGAGLQPGNLHESFWRGRLDEVTGWTPGAITPGAAAG